jgi:hypothetical protein
VSWFFVDCETEGTCPCSGRLTEFGCVEFESLQTFHGILDLNRRAVYAPSSLGMVVAYDVFEQFFRWIRQRSDEKRALFISDNPAWDWSWINHGFHLAGLTNPFGHSGRRIGDFYAGLCGDFTASTSWKALRMTIHDHNPVNDAMGNVEAFQRMLHGERAQKRLCQDPQHAHLHAELARLREKLPWVVRPDDIR